MAGRKRKSNKYDTYLNIEGASFDDIIKMSVRNSIIGYGDFILDKGSNIYSFVNEGVNISGAKTIEVSGTVTNGIVEIHLTNANGNQKNIFLNDDSKQSTIYGNYNLLDYPLITFEITTFADTGIAKIGYKLFD